MSVALGSCLWQVFSPGGLFSYRAVNPCSILVLGDSEHSICLQHERGGGSVEVMVTGFEAWVDLQIGVVPSSLGSVHLSDEQVAVKHLVNDPLDLGVHGDVEFVLPVSLFRVQALWAPCPVVGEGLDPPADGVPM